MRKRIYVNAFEYLYQNKDADSEIRKKKIAFFDIVVCSAQSFLISSSNDDHNKKISCRYGICSTLLTIGRRQHRKTIALHTYCTCFNPDNYIYLYNMIYDISWYLICLSK
mmetsp:Transcript_31878/g.30392  ORF Transcript_31878/g.30392 Transcript_31878/m.30392 type:complete len:110 (-) Transcript_31878:1613-1942(-)